ncbi:hypothetical protein AX14_002595 [Amanita brunnescens Koide BX004]|nr:hypothetical protein AX14_002595 [Amanita brunnescens Koide BX004]
MHKLGGGPEEKVALCRNSLDDLEIMSVRISKAQVGLRRDLGMVRGFAQSAEHLSFRLHNVEWSQRSSVANKKQRVAWYGPSCVYKAVST